MGIAIFIHSFLKESQHVMPALFDKQLAGFGKWNFQRFSIDDWGTVKSNFSANTFKLKRISFCAFSPV